MVQRLSQPGAEPLDPGVTHTYKITIYCTVQYFTVEVMVVLLAFVLVVGSVISVLCDDGYELHRLFCGSCLEKSLLENELCTWCLVTMIVFL